MRAQKAWRIPTVLRLAASHVPAIRSLNIKRQMTMRCQSSKVPALTWSNEGRYLLTASQDGYLVLWNPHHGQKVQAIPTPVPYVMCCAYCPSGLLVASGGLDNACSIYNLRHRESAVDVPVEHTLVGHSGYISACEFLDDYTLFTASGDGTIVQWDTESETPVHTFSEHQGDVLSLALSPTSPDVFVSSGIDSHVRVWDRRTGRVQHTFTGHRSDVNSVAMFPDGMALASSSDDGTCRLWDVRSQRELNIYEPATSASPVKSIAFSRSGRMLCAGYENHKCVVWDTLRAEAVATLTGHDARVTCVRTCPTGERFATAGWDGKVVVWGI
ncbi:g protein complex beta subunit [Malassezia pachydermatis]|uniref:G protein complex beta subunit n=1 Tax=Malassezia pachydermatis TaxID=77020 RepID=A0A0M9VP24_9BASI|nr:g protein complex beta subunit [Malassezia pachydermatis]KOS13959.1 g protein complex beta subunit [Malassezia pachydermatis]